MTDSLDNDRIEISQGMLREAAQKQRHPIPWMDLWDTLVDIAVREAEFSSEPTLYHENNRLHRELDLANNEINELRRALRDSEEQQL